MKMFLLAGFMLMGTASSAAAQGNLGAMTAAAPSLAQMRTACKIGAAPQLAGTEASTFKWGDATPTKIAGATTVSATEAKCVIDRFPGAVLVADAAGDSSIGDAFGFRWVGGPTATDQQTADLRRVLATISGARTDMPIVVYCHHIRCAFSYYAAQRMVAAGYTSVLWMRGGTEEWKAAGYPMESRPNRWTGPASEAIKAFNTCFSKQPIPQDVQDAKAATDMAIRACAAEQRGMKTSLDNYDRKTGMNVAASTSAQIRKSYEDLSKSRIETAAKLAEQNEKLALAEKELKERHAQYLYLQGSSGQNTMEIYQYCRVTERYKFGRKNEYRQYYSEIFPHRISNKNEGKIDNFNNLSREFGSEFSNAFIEYVKRIAQGDRFNAWCYSSETEDGAKSRWDVEHNLIVVKNDKKVDLPWTPNTR